MKKHVIKLAGIGLAVFAALVAVTVADIKTNDSAVVADAATEDVKSSESFACAADLLAEDETSVIAAAYSEAGSAECMFVGCGGIF